MTLEYENVVGSAMTQLSSISSSIGSPRFQGKKETLNDQFGTRSARETM